MIYRILNTITGDTYVGYTSKSLADRFQKHCYNSTSGRTYLYKAMRKYGTENFTIECLQADGTLEEDESLWIGKLSPRYNMTSGGEGGNTSKSPAYQQSLKTTDRSGKKNPMFGKHGKSNPNSQGVILDGVRYDTLTQARKLAKKSFYYVKSHGIMV